MPWKVTKILGEVCHLDGQLPAQVGAGPHSLNATQAIIGTGQPTATTAQLTRGGVELISTYQDQDLYGDSTVRPDVQEQAAVTAPSSAAQAFSVI